MTGFWLGSIILVVVAGYFVFLPIISQGKRDKMLSLNTQEERVRENVKIYKQRLADLEASYEASEIDSDTYEGLKNELKLTLLSDAMIEKPSFLTKNKDFIGSVPKSGFGLSIGALVVVVAMSYGLYFELGSYDKQLQRQQMAFNQAELNQAKRLAEQGDMNALLNQLYDKLQSSPDNVEGWLLLARTAMNLGKYDLAIEGYESAISSLEKSGQDSATIYGLLAQAYYFQANSGQLTQKVNEALSSAFERNKNEVNALGLLAIHSFDSKNYQDAIKYWAQILAADPEHPARLSIEGGIARARSLLGQSDEQEDVKEQNIAGPSIEVTVELDSKILDKVSPSDTVFIFARSENGPPLPLAASRHVVAEFPLTIVLDDSKAMSPAAKLSQVETVNVVARVSKSGDPIAKPGDYQGIQNGLEVKVGQRTKVIIDSQL